MTNRKKLLCCCFSKYGLIPLLLALSYNNLVYAVSGLLVKNRTLHSLALEIDQDIPLIPWTIIIYFGCYLFWGINYIMIYRQKKEFMYRFFISDLLSRTICFVCFLAYPTTIARPQITGDGLLCGLMRLLYRIDEPVNLFPSIHCLVSWNCFIGIRGSKEVPRWYQYVSFFIAILVFVSTLTTRQHVVLDVVGGVLLSEITYYIGQRTEMWRYVERKFDKIADRLFPGGDSAGAKERNPSYWFL